MPYAQAIKSLQHKIAEDKRSLDEEERSLATLIRLQRESETRHGVIDSSANPPTDTGRQRVLLIPEPQGLTLIEATRKIVAQLGGQEFDVPQIQALLPSVGYELGGKYPRARLSSTLEKLAKAKEIVRTFTGKGSVPHRYRAAS